MLASELKPKKKPLGCDVRQRLISDATKEVDPEINESSRQRFVTRELLFLLGWPTRPMSTNQMQNQRVRPPNRAGATMLRDSGISAVDTVPLITSDTFGTRS